MKKFTLALFALLTLGIASAMPIGEASNGGGNEVDGRRGMWLG